MNTRDLVDIALAIDFDRKYKDFCVGRLSPPDPPTLPVSLLINIFKSHGKTLEHYKKDRVLYYLDFADSGGYGIRMGIDQRQFELGRLHPSIAVMFQSYNKHIRAFGSYGMLANYSRAARNGRDKPNERDMTGSEPNFKNEEELSECFNFIMDLYEEIRPAVLSKVGSLTDPEAN